MYELGSATRITKSRRFILGGVAVTRPRSDRHGSRCQGSAAARSAANSTRRPVARFVFSSRDILFINPQCCRMLKARQQQQNHMTRQADSSAPALRAAAPMGQCAMYSMRGVVVECLLESQAFGRAVQSSELIRNSSASGASDFRARLYLFSAAPFGGSVRPAEQDCRRYRCCVAQRSEWNFCRWMRLPIPWAIASCYAGIKNYPTRRWGRTRYPVAATVATASSLFTWRKISRRARAAFLTGAPLKSPAARAGSSKDE